jgi:fructose-specific component phosphotransferase system IIB-like protein
MQSICKFLFSLSILAAPVFAGGLAIEIGNPAANPEAQGKNAALVARITACRSPEKTTVTAAAEGLVNGVRRSVPLKVVPLSTAGTFAVPRETMDQGTWVVKLTATNPDFKNYATSVLVPMTQDSLQWASVHRYFHEATDAEVVAVLGEPAKTYSARN